MSQSNTANLDSAIENPTPSSSYVFENGQDSVDGQKVLDVHVVLLNNYLRMHHVVSYQALAKRVRKLTILLSTPMEPGREWDPEWGGLDVRLQKNWMITKTWRHSSGFSEKNFIHIPIDTVKQLRTLKPDIVFSYEMGMRTILSGWFRRFNKKIPLVMVGNMSQHIEKERGLLRRSLRSLIRRFADYFTYNGPSCKRYLATLGIADEKLFHVPYCIDDRVVYQGPRELASEGQPLRLFYSGTITERKGLIPFIEGLSRWCAKHSDRKILFQLAGKGDLNERLEAFATENLQLEFFGNLDVDGLRSAHQRADICVMPSFADEWALTPIEGLASGIPVLGSFYAQSVEAVVKEDVNGWIFVPDQEESVDKAISSALALSKDELFDRVSVCRDSVAHITPEATAECFCNVIRSVLPDKAKLVPRESRS